MPEFVRARVNATGHHVSIPRALAEMKPALYSPLKSPAVDVNGRPARPKHKIAGAPAPEASKATTTESEAKEAIK